MSLSEAIARASGQVCYECRKNFAPKKLAGLCHDCFEKPVEDKPEPHDYWCLCEQCEEDFR